MAPREDGASERGATVTDAGTRSAAGSFVTRPSLWRPALPATEPPAPDDLADRAVDSAEARAIKLTEACLRLHAEHQDPVLLHAAARASELLK
jgi:hypothetical protein